MLSTTLFKSLPARTEAELVPHCLGTVYSGDVQGRILHTEDAHGIPDVWIELTQYLQAGGSRRLGFVRAKDFWHQSEVLRKARDYLEKHRSFL
jgi:hypothetical protein